MQKIRAHKKGLLAVTCGALLVGAAVVMAQQSNSKPAAGPEINRLVVATDARALSSVFRDVTKKALSGVVSIQTLSGSSQSARTFRSPFGEDSPFRGLFKDDPRLREFFKEFGPDMRDVPRRMPRRRGMGSGFIIDARGVVLTNYHVVRGAGQVKITLSDGREFVVKDIKSDPRTDVAILRFDAPQGLTALKLGDSSKLQIGDWVLAVGSPFGLHGTVTAGIISAKGRGPGITQREEFLQTDAAINPGNSGGPLLNLDGEVIGINTAISTRSGGYDGIGFAIPINMAKWVSGQLVAKGTVRRSYLGVGVPRPGTVMGRELAKRYNVERGGGAIVGEVFPDSPAEAARLRRGDVIIELDGSRIGDGGGLQAGVEKLSPGKTYSVVIVRNGERKTVSVKMQAMPDRYSAASPGRPQPSDPDESDKALDALGLEVTRLTPAIARQLGLKGLPEGVVVSDLRDGGLAMLAGLQTGDVITKVGGKIVKSPSDFRKAMQQASLAEGVLLLVTRGGGVRFVIIQNR